MIKIYFGGMTKNDLKNYDVGSIMPNIFSYLVLFPLWSPMVYV